MKARVRFALTQGNVPFTVTAPGALHGRAHDRAGALMRFSATACLAPTLFEGDLWWVNGPSEQDFGRGVRFSLMPNIGEGELLG